VFRQFACSLPERIAFFGLKTTLTFLPQTSALNLNHHPFHLITSSCQSASDNVATAISRAHTSFHSNRST
jgi:hypothetical protein